MCIIMPPNELSGEPLYQTFGTTEATKNAKKSLAKR